MDIRSTTLSHQDLSGKRTLAALFPPDKVDEAIQALIDAGFPRDQVGVVMRRRGTDGKLVEDGDTLAGEGLAEGAVAGGVAGGALGLLAGLGALLIPGIGPVMAGGIIGSMLIGAGVGAIGGGLVGTLVGLGIPENQASYFEEGMRQGGAIVVVNALDRTDEARDIMTAHGGTLGPFDIDEGTRLVEESRERGDGPVML